MPIWWVWKKPSGLFPAIEYAVIGMLSAGPVTSEEAQRLVASVPAWHHSFEIAPGIFTPGSYDPHIIWNRMELPEDLSGQRVLDIGASDGFFSLKTRQRGAQLVAIDYRPKDLHGFGVMERISGLEFDYRQINLFDVTPETLGTFDIVLCLGVLYHLPDMMRGLSIVRSVCHGQMFLETSCAAEFAPEIPAARYFREKTMNEDLTNFWSPNIPCIHDMLYDSAFDVTHGTLWADGDRYLAACRVNEHPARLYKLRLAYGLVSSP